jgi:AcrR family transcriptional regulator
MGSASRRSTVDDKTTQAKIRDAAIARFPVDGLKGTTVRAIAKDAGVSPGLVIHHFGSKQGLHRACDEYVVNALSEMKREALATGTYRSGGGIAAMYQMADPTLSYIAWTLGTGGETASRIFDDLVVEATELFEEGKRTGTIGEVYGDPHKQAAVLVSMQFATIVFHDHLSRAFGLYMLSAEGLAASAPYTLQIFSGDLFSKEVIAQTKQALKELDELQEETR